mmetsp:Transcript_15091/g.40464  ORF Transcript_15091/g.40464 Transcript_15091/m.40464 type:complete len:118 (-) Transcript_15091:142-495(-)
MRVRHILLCIAVAVLAVASKVRSAAAEKIGDYYGGGATDFAYGQDPYYYYHDELKTYDGYGGYHQGGILPGDIAFYPGVPVDGVGVCVAQTRRCCGCVSHGPIYGPGYCGLKCEPWY